MEGVEFVSIAGQWETDGEEEIRISCLGECGGRKAEFKTVVVWLPKCIPANAVFPEWGCI